MLYAAIYQLWNLIYVLSGGKDDSGNDYLYAIYDWNNNPSGAGIQVAIFFLSHLVGYLLGAFIKKIILYKYLVHKQELNVTTSIHMDNM